MVEDKYSFGSTQINLIVGKEFRRGSTRLQVGYGASDSSFGLLDDTSGGRLGLRLYF